MAASRVVKVELLGESKGLASAFGAAEKAAGGFTGFIGKIGGGLATFGLAAQGVGVLGKAVGGFVSSALEGERAMAQTEAVIKSTGGAAGLTAKEIASLADGFEKMTPFSAEAVQEGENLLLTFTNIGKDVFPQATETMLDMATALGTDAKGGAVQLGKALNDPIAGISALTRVGVTFTDAQKDQIKAMVEAGDVAGAQKVILQELQKEFGGSAKAAGETFAGKLEILKNRFGNLQEVIGAALIPALIKLADRAMPFVERGVEKLAQILPVVLAWFGRLAERLQGPLTKAFTLIRDGVLTFIQALSGDWADNENIHGLHRVIGNVGLVIREQVIPAVIAFAGFFEERLLPIIKSFGETFTTIFSSIASGNWGEALQGLIDGFVERLGLVGGILADLGQMFIAWIEPMIPPMLEKLGGLVVSIGDWIVNQGVPMLTEKLGQWADAFGAWAVVAVPPMLEKLGLLLDALGVWMADTGLPLLGEKLGQWGQAFVDWIGPRLEPMLTALGELLLAVGDWIVTHAAPEIGAKLLEWGKQFVAWVQPQIGPLLGELGNLLSQLGAWLWDTALPAIAAALAEWGAAFVAWVGPQIPPLLAELGNLLAQFGSWLIGTALPEITTKLGEWGLAFVKWVAPQIPPLLIELGVLLMEIAAWMTSEALPKIIEQLAKWGAAFIGWIAKDVLPSLPGALAEIIGTIASWAAGAVGEVSGSVVQIGTAVLEGIAAGIRNGAQAIVGAAINAALSLIPDWARKALDINSPSRVMIPIGLAITEGVAVGIELGSRRTQDAAYAAGADAARAYRRGADDGMAGYGSRPGAGGGYGSPGGPGRDRPRDGDGGYGSRPGTGGDGGYGTLPPLGTNNASRMGGNARGVFSGAFAGTSSAAASGGTIPSAGGGGGGTDNGMDALREGATFLGCSWELTGANNDNGLFQWPNGEKHWRSTRFCRNGQTGPTEQDYGQAARSAAARGNSLPQAARPEGSRLVAQTRTAADDPHAGIRQAVSDGMVDGWRRIQTGAARTPSMVGGS